MAEAASPPAGLQHAPLTSASKTDGAALRPLSQDVGPHAFVRSLIHQQRSPDSSRQAPSFAASSVKEPWSSSVWDTLKLFSLQLATLGGSSAVAKTAVAPLDRIKVLLQVQAMSRVDPQEKYRGLRDALYRIPKREGYWALFRGNGTALTRLFPEVGLRFALHDQLLTMFSPTNGQPLGFSGKLGAGMTAGVLRTVVCYPLELAATRVAADASPLRSPRLYSGWLHCLHETLRHEGVRGLYKGVLLSGVGASAYIGVSFAAYDELNGYLPRDRPSYSAWWFPGVKIGTGAAAGLLGQAVCYPLDTVRRRMQLSGSPGQVVRYTSYVHCVREMTRLEGVAGFYRGVGVNCIKTVPGAVIQFLAFDAIKSLILFTDPSLVSSSF